MAHDERMRMTDAEPLDAPRSGQTQGQTDGPMDPDEILDRLALDEETREVLDQSLEALRDRVREAEERLLRVEAEAENRGKRLEREKEDAIRFANEALVTRLLPALDNLEVCESGAAGASTEQLLEALRMTLGELREAFESIGIELVSASPGERFDPKVHDATVRDDASGLPRNTVVRVLQDGVRYHGRLLRPVRVVVAGGNG